MKLFFQLFSQPGKFFNQMQWSSRHWFIIVSFLTLALVETHVGRGQNEFYQVALWISHQWSVSFNVALWIVLAGRMALIIGGAYVVTTAVWVVGNIFGHRTSRRVLARRLAVVFTVGLAAYTMQYFVDAHPMFGVASLFLYVWSLILGYFAIRENFGLTHLESVVVGLFAVLLITSSWHYSHHALAEKFMSSTSTASNAKAPFSKDSYIKIVR